MSIRFALLASVLCLTLALGACRGGEGGPNRFLSIGTGGTGGIYYPLGGAVSARLSVRDSTRSYTAEVTGGSVENVNRVLQGQIDLGFTLAVSAYEAYHGAGDEGADGGGDADAAAADASGTDGSRLRIVAPLYPNVVHVMAREGAGIQGVGDLAGMRVSVGSAGSGTEQTARQLLGAYGLDYEDVSTQFLTFRESAAALRDGAIDAAILSVGFPAAAVLEATTSGGVGLVPVTGAGRDTLFARFPYYQEGEIPAGVYAGVDAPVATVAMNNWIVARDDLDPRVVENLLWILENERGELASVHEMARQIDLANLAAAPIPVHEAAGGTGEAPGGA